MRYIQNDLPLSYKKNSLTLSSSGVKSIDTYKLLSLNYVGLDSLLYAAVLACKLL